MIQLSIVCYDLGLSFFDFSVTKWDDLASIITLLSLFYLIRTVNEMIRQRRESYKPKIIPNSLHCYLEGNHQDFPDVWRDRNKAERVYSGQLQIDFHNIGVGPGIEPTVIWLPNRTYILNEINDNIEDGKIIFSAGKQSIEYVPFQKDELYISRRSFIESQKKEHYLLPKTLNHYVTITLYRKSLNKGFGEKVPIKPILLYVELKDLGGKKIRKFYKLCFEFYSSDNYKSKIANGVVFPLAVGKFKTFIYILKTIPQRRKEMNILHSLSGLKND